MAKESLMLFLISFYVTLLRHPDDGSNCIGFILLDTDIFLNYLIIVLFLAPSLLVNSFERGNLCNIEAFIWVENKIFSIFFRRKGYDWSFPWMYLFFPLLFNETLTIWFIC